MNSCRKSSLIFGLFFAGTFVFSVPALFFYTPILNNPDYVIGMGMVNTRISMGALCEILLAICNVSTAIIAYPLLRRANESLSLGYVTVRVVESLLILTGVVAIMSIVTLQANSADGVDKGSLVAVGHGLLAFHDWTFLLGPQFCAGLGNGILLGFPMYQSQMVPRRVAMIGIVGGPLAFVGGVLVLFDVLEPMSGGLFALTALEIIWELSLTFIALFKGFAQPTFTGEG